MPPGVTWRMQPAKAHGRTDCESVLPRLQDLSGCLLRRAVAIVGDSTSRELYREMVTVLAGCDTDGGPESWTQARRSQRACDLPAKFHESTLLFSPARDASGVLPGATRGAHLALSYFGVSFVHTLFEKPWFPAVFAAGAGTPNSTARAYDNGGLDPTHAFAQPPVYDLVLLNMGLWNLRYSSDPSGAAMTPEQRIDEYLRDVKSLITRLTALPQEADAARRRVVWRSISPVEHTPGVTVHPFTAQAIDTVNAQVSRLWRDAGFAVLDSAKYLQHATLRPDFSAPTSSLLLTRDGIHPAPVVSRAIAREVLALAMVSGPGSADGVSVNQLKPVERSPRASAPYLPADPLRAFNEPLFPSSLPVLMVVYTLVWIACAWLYRWLASSAAPARKPNPAASTKVRATEGDAKPAVDAAAAGATTETVVTVAVLAGASAAPVADAATTSAATRAAAAVPPASAAETNGVPAPRPASKEATTSASETQLTVAEWHKLAIAAGCLALVCLLCLVFDGWHVFPVVHKLKFLGNDLYVSLVGLLLLAAVRWSLHTASETSASDDVLMSLNVTEETKGWMMFLLLAYHYYDVKPVYNFMRMLVAGYLWLTGYGNTLSLKKTPPTVAKFGLTFLRLNLLCTCMALATNQPWMLYYICPLHTIWALVTVMLHWHRNVSPWVRYAVAAGMITLIWHVDIVFDAVFFVFRPMLMYRGSMYEWRFRSKLDCYATLLGCIFAECRDLVMPALTIVARPGEPAWLPKLRVGGIAVTCTAIIVWYASFFLAMEDRFGYNKYHPYLSPLVLVAFVILRGCTGWLRRTHSKLFVHIGRCSLEYYLLQFHVWLSGNAKYNVVPLPHMRMTSLVLQTALFAFCVHIASHGVSNVLSILRDRPTASIVSLVLCCAALSASAYFDGRSSLMT